MSESSVVGGALIGASLGVLAGLGDIGMVFVIGLGGVTGQIVTEGYKDD